MLTNDKSITTPEYWDKVYAGKNDNAKVDASNTKRVSTFDRFDIVVPHVVGPRVIDIGSGHAHICKRVAAQHRDWYVLASDQASAARKVANYFPYEIFSGYEIPYPDKQFDTLMITQAMEYIDEVDRFMREACRVAKYFVCTVPAGEMGAWSQLRIYSKENLAEFLEAYGDIEVLETHPSLILAKIKFYD